MIKVIGIGNRFRRDDGLGPVVIERLRASAANAPGVEFATCSPDSLIGALEGADAALIIDASAPATQPGHISRVEYTGGQLPLETTASTHGFGLAHHLALAGAMGVLADTVIVFAMEVADISHGEGLSPAVQACVPNLLKRVIGEIENAIAKAS